jgi:6-phospho-3-hexuloisomerase
METYEVAAGSFTANTELILAELGRTLGQVNDEQMAEAVEALLAAPRIFVAGAGRSGLAIRMIAMRLMHLGLDVYVVGETTTPAIRRGDLLLVASGSGTTASAVRAAVTAHRVGADVLALTTAPGSRLGELARWIVEIPAATKQDHRGSISGQYAGALFEQAVLLTMDAGFQQMWQNSSASAEQLYTRHANLE